MIRSGLGIITRIGGLIMSFFQNLIKVGISAANSVIEEGMEKLGQMDKEAERKYSQQTGYNAQNSHGKTTVNPYAIGGRTLDEWEQEWRGLGILNNLNLTPYNRYVGVYRAWLNNRIIYIGRAIEWNNGGFRKRLSDYTRDSDSARKHKSGQKMYEYRDQLNMEIIITGSDEESTKVAGQLEARLIAKYQPAWNVKINI